MKKHKMKATNSVSFAKWNRVKLTHQKNRTTTCILVNAYDLPVVN